MNASQDLGRLTLDASSIEEVKILAKRQGRSMPLSDEAKRRIQQALKSKARH